MSPRSGSWQTHKFRSVLELLHDRRFQAINGGLPRNSPIMAARAPVLGTGNWMHQPGLQFFSTNSNRSTDAKYERLKNIKVQPPVPASSTSSFTFPYWLRWVLGSVLPVMLAFNTDWDKLLRIEGEAEVLVEEVEKVAKVVEKVATTAEKVSEEVAEKLPLDSDLKKAALVVEKISKQAAHDAQLTQDFTHKVDDLKNDLDALEAFLEPVLHKTVGKESQSK